MKTNRTTLTLWLLAACVLLLSTPPASASTLQDGVSTVSIESSPTLGGLFTWSVGGIEVMPEQWFWFRVGNAAEQPLGIVGMATDSTFFAFPGPNIATWSYSASGIDFGVTAQLTDAEPTRSLNLVVSASNTSTSAVTLSIFHYMSFRLGAGSNQADINGNTVTQTGSGYTAEVSVAPFDSRLLGFEAAAVPYTLNRLGDGTSTDFGSTMDSASGDVSAAFEWQMQLPGKTGDATSSFQLSMNEHLTVPETQNPEPASAALVLGALVAIFLPRRRSSHPRTRR